ncbi:MAG: hypothetical protein ABIA76_01495 [Candidatus Diapherotrites archaeon]
MNKLKSKLNPLPKSMRERKRYLLFKLKNSISRKELTNKLYNAFLNEFDSIGFAKADPRIIFSENGFGLLRVNFAFVDKAKKLLKKNGFELISVHGTIKSSKKKLIN